VSEVGGWTGLLLGYRYLTCNANISSFGTKTKYILKYMKILME